MDKLDTLNLTNYVVYIVNYSEDEVASIYNKLNASKLHADLNYFYTKPPLNEPKNVRYIPNCYTKTLPVLVDNSRKKNLIVAKINSDEEEQFFNILINDFVVNKYLFESNNEFYDNF